MTRHELCTWLRERDIEFFVSQKTLGKARKELNVGRSKDDRVSAAAFRDAAYDVCHYWKVARRKPKRRNHCLSEGQWTDLKRAVTALRVPLRSVDLDGAVELVRTKVSCSRQTLLGLPSRLHYWRG